MEIGAAFSEAGRLILSGDAQLLGIVALTLRVSFTAVALSILVGVPLGGLLALARFPGRGAVLALVNGLMGLPPVVVGLAVYLMLSRSGPLGFMGLLFTPTAMILAQCILVLPIVTALSRQMLEDLWLEYREYFQSLGLGPWRSVPALAYEGRYSLLTAALAGFGRAIAEVGAVMIVGGNIAHVTRVMTTAIALETSKGDLALALGLGLILIGLSLAVNLAANGLREATAVGHG